MVGRPQTLDRNHALAVALEGYWREGLYGMSVNEVCRRAAISKPGLYREFGGEDGLLTAVVQLYRDTVLQKLFEHLRSPYPFRSVLAGLINEVLRPTGDPPGCLLGELRMVKFDDLGEETRHQVEVYAAEVRDNYRVWLDRAQRNGEIPADLDLDTAARHIDTQVMTACFKANRGGDVAEIKAELEVAFWRLVPNLSL